MRTPSDGAPASQRPLDQALARAVLYDALATSLRRPSAAERHRVFSPDGRQAILAAAAVLDAEGRSATALRPLVEAWSSLGARAGDGFFEAHDRLFGHSRGLVCVFETEYGPESGFEQPQNLADIAGSYRAFGLEPCPGRDERVDHVACECEFAGFLARREAFTLGLGMLNDELLIVRSAERGFLREHLGRFGRAFASRLLKEDPAGFFGALGSVLFGLLTQDCRRFGVAPGQPVLELRPPPLDEAPLACGSSGGCTAAGERIPLQRQRR